jgi:glucose-6-phosphate 1-dehydrogenase
MPALVSSSPVIRYPAGSWGPDEANLLIEPHRWHTHSKAVT